MSYYDPRVERKAGLIVYHIQTNESIHLSDKSKWDIYSNVRECANYWKAEHDAFMASNPILKLNELRLWYRFNKPYEYKNMEKLLIMLNSGEYIRNTRVEDLLEEE